MPVLGLCIILQAQDASQRWIFEGAITNVDPQLTPDLQNSWVLSGSFALNRLDQEIEPGLLGEGKGRIAGGVKSTELSLDLYHTVYFEARQAAGLAGFDFHDNDESEDGRDLMAWFFPVRGQIQSGKWTSRWLQVWLVDPDGKMVGEVPPVVGLNGLDWQSAWFRLTFESEQGSAVYVDGVIELFCPESDDLEESDWRGVAAELSEELLKRDGTIVSLRQELAAAKDRNDALRQMVDLLVQERTHLQEQIASLEQKAAAGDPEIQQQIDDLEVEKSLLSIEIEELNERNLALAESLARSEQSRLELLSKLEDVPVDQPEFVELPQVVRLDPVEPEVDPELVVEPVVEPEAPVEPAMEPVVIPDEEVKVEKVEADEKSEPRKVRKPGVKQRKPGPRKFR